MSRVLIVDDDPDFLEFSRACLEREGFEVDCASNSAEAMRRLEAQTPDVALLDMMMSFVLEGMSLTRTIRSDERFKHIPILIISSLSGAQGRDISPLDEQATIDGWISKPVRPAELVQRINAVLEQV